MKTPPPANDNGAFLCTKLACKLSVSACASRWRRTLTLFPVGVRGEIATHELLSCRGCAVGADNARGAA